MRPLFAVFCLLLLGCPLCGAATPASWLEVKTAHFTVLSNAGDRQVRHTAGQLERMQSVFAKLLPHATDDPGAPIVVLALKDRKDFNALEPPAYLGKNALELAGYFMRGDNKNYILLRLDTAGDHPYATVYHEYTHYMSRHADYLPTWLSEGLAQFYQNTDIGDHFVKLGQPDANEILFLRQQQLLSLTTLFTVDADSPYYHEDNKGNIFYAESWALTHLLFLQDFGKPEGRLHRYAELMSQGHSSLEAATLAFGDLRQLQSALLNYINNGEYKALSMPLQNAVDERTLVVQPLATTDADALRADVLARNGREKEAEALDKAVLAEAPGSAQAHESMGTIELRKGNNEAAAKWFREAAGLHSEDFLTYYYAGAMTLAETGKADDTVFAYLQECLKRNPAFAPAMMSLSEADARSGKLDEALHMSLRAVALDPRNIDYRLNASEIRVERKELPSAISGLQATAKLARTPEERARVEARLQAVQTYQAQLEQAQARKAERVEEQRLTMVKANSADPHGGSKDAPAPVRDREGHLIHLVKMVEPDHKFPDAPLNHVKHTVTGTVRQVGCFAPKGLLLTIDGAGKQVPLYSNDMYSVAYTSGNFTPKGVLNPCEDFDGLKATVTYSAVTDPAVQGQILAMELNH